MTTRSTAAWAEVERIVSSRSSLLSSLDKRSGLTASFGRGSWRAIRTIGRFDEPRPEEAVDVGGLVLGFTLLLGTGGIGHGLGGLKDAGAEHAGFFVGGARHDLFYELRGASGELGVGDVVQCPADFVHVPDHFGLR